MSLDEYKQWLVKVQGEIIAVRDHAKEEAMTTESHNAFFSAKADWQRCEEKLRLINQIIEEAGKIETARMREFL